MQALRGSLEAPYCWEAILSGYESRIGAGQAQQRLPDQSAQLRVCHPIAISFFRLDIAPQESNILGRGSSDSCSISVDFSPNSLLLGFLMQLEIWPPWWLLVWSVSWALKWSCLPLSPVVSGCLPLCGGWVLVGVAAFLGSEVVLSPVVSGCLPSCGGWLVWPHLEQKYSEIKITGFNLNLFTVNCLGSTLV